VQEGDEIIAVDSVSTVGWEMGRVTERTRGEAGTKVKVTFLREGVAEPVILTLTRAVVHIPAVPFSFMVEPGIGYIPLQVFNESSAEEVTNAVMRLHHEGAKSLILDLRGNGGGILGQSLAVSSLFLRPGQPIVSVRGRNGMNEADSAAGRRLEAQLPLVILTDEGSASASEIVAGALQDHDRALVVGARSYGKGLVQQTFPLEGGYLFKVTTGKWFTPSGRSIHRDRTLQADGRYVEKPADTTKAPLPKFKSASGRTVLGGGGIFPDITVAQDTLSTPEQEVIRAVAPRATLVNAFLLDEAARHKSVKPDFKVEPAWLNEVVRRLDSAGVKVDERLKPAREAFLERELGRRISRLAFSDSGAARREFPIDNQLTRALALLRGKTTQSALFAAAK
jgi:carboxyl-terminal processing protease